MIAATLVTVVVNGAIVSSSVPARIVAGRVVAPLAPIVIRLATRVAYAAGASTITVERAGIRIAVPVALMENDDPFVELAPVVHALGGTATFDAPSKTLAIDFPSAAPIATPVPYDPESPRVEPAIVVTPAPTRPTPRSTDTTAPHPRRTAIPALPSQPAVPVIPLPDPGPTDRHR